jgi:RNA recognition motif-containing protein
LADFFQIELEPKENKMSVKLYVGNLAYSTTEEELRTLFAQAGAVTSVALIKDRFTGDSKGFAFVEMESQADAQKAITQFNGSKLGDRDLKVNLARPREERGGFGGGGGYNRGGSGGGRGGNDRGRGGPRRY